MGLQSPASKAQRPCAVPDDQAAHLWGACCSLLLPAHARSLATPLQFSHRTSPRSYLPKKVHAAPPSPSAPRLVICSAYVPVGARPAQGPYRQTCPLKGRRAAALQPPGELSVAGLPQPGARSVGLAGERPPQALLGGGVEAAAGRRRQPCRTSMAEVGARGATCGWP